MLYILGAESAAISPKLRVAMPVYDQNAALAATQPVSPAATPILELSPAAAIQETMEMGTKTSLQVWPPLWLRHIRDFAKFYMDSAV